MSIVGEFSSLCGIGFGVKSPIDFPYLIVPILLLILYLRHNHVTLFIDDIVIVIRVRIHCFSIAIHT